MKMVKTVAIALILIIAFSASALAAETRRPSINPRLTFNGRTANCDIVVTSVGDDIEVTLELWYGSTLVGSWEDSGTTSVSIAESCTVVRGRTYTLKAYGVIDGEDFSGTPVSRECP